MLLQNNSKLLFIGDSITDCQRDKPIGEGLFDSLGKGYVNFIAALLDTTYPERTIRVVNMGTSGNTVRELKERWDSDVISQRPDWISIMIGTNDVWRQYDIPRLHEYHVYIEEYEKTLEFLIQKTLPVCTGLILMTPFFIEVNTSDSMRITMDQYGLVVKQLSQKYNTVLVDTQAAFDNLLKHCHSSAIAWDRIHPNATGHMTLAKAFLKGIKFEW